MGISETFVLLKFEIRCNFEAVRKKSIYQK